MENPQFQHDQYPEPVVCAIIQHPSEDKVLMIKSRAYDNTYRILKAHIALGETIEESLQRNILKETGYNAKPIKILSIQESIFSEEYKEPHHFIFLVYYCKVNKLEQAEDVNPLSEFVWIEEADALDLTMSQSNRELMKIYLSIRSEMRV